MPLPISVILPLVRGRGRERECLTAWLCDQTFPRSDYEVILVSNGEDPELDGWVKSRLAPCDQLVRCRTRNEFELFHKGALRAKGRYLAFSELHCVPANDYLSQVHCYLLDNPVAGASCRSVNGASDAPLYERMEGLKFATDFRHRMASAMGMKVLMHGFTLQRETYFEAGGFEYQYGPFAEWAFGARLDAMKIELGYCPEATVYHHYGSSLAEVRGYIEEFWRGEFAFREANDRAYCDKYFGPLPPAERAAALPRETGRSLWRALGKSLLQDVSSGDATQLNARGRRFIGLLPAAVFGVPEEMLRARAAEQAALARLWLWRFNFKKCYQAYLDYWDARTRIVHLQNALDENRSVALWPESFDYHLATIEEARHAGFGEAEKLEGRAFRWSEPVASIKIAAPPGDYEIELAVLDLRPWTLPQRLHVYLGTQRLECTTVDFGRGFARFRAPSSVWTRPDNQYDLVIVSSEYKAREFGAINDRRDLGIPLSAVHLSPAAPEA